MDISTLTNLINVFRTALTNSITPDTLGQQLQKIVNVQETASTVALALWCRE